MKVPGTHAVCLRKFLDELADEIADMDAAQARALIDDLRRQVRGHEPVDPAVEQMFEAADVSASLCDLADRHPDMPSFFDWAYPPEDD